MGKILRVVAVAGLGACSGSQRPTPTTKPADDHHKYEIEAARDQERARLEREINQDPVKALIGLGIPTGRFEPIARAIYSRWNEEHGSAGNSLAECKSSRELIAARLVNSPADAALELGIPVESFGRIGGLLYQRWAQTYPDRVQRPAATTTTVASRPQATQQTSSEDDQRWWCFRTRTLNTCDATRAECESWRARFADAENCDRYSTAWEKKACIDAAAEVRGIDRCRRQDRAACFSKENLLHGKVLLDCAPSIEDCKKSRIFAMREMKDDIKVRSECKAVE